MDVQVVVGSSFIGMETAATLSRMGADVTVVGMVGGRVVRRVWVCVVVLSGGTQHLQ